MKIKRNEGITLVALVVTIVILIILATISIRAVFSERGIINQAKEAKEMHEEAREEESQTIGDLMREYNEVKDELSSGGVKINISKYPEIEKTRVAFLVVESVEGITTYKTEEIDGMSESKKKEIIKKLAPQVVNMEEGTNYTTFEEYLVAHNVTEQEFWTNIGDVTSCLQNIIVGLGLYDRITNEVKLYTVINPDGEKTSLYKAMANGKYTFTITDIIANKTYRKSIEVTNIDTTLPMPLFEVMGGRNRIVLREKATEDNVSFEKAYVIYKGEKIDVTSCIGSRYKTNDYLDVWRVFETVFKVSEVDGMSAEVNVVLIKDGVEYIGYVLCWCRAE